MLDGYIALSAFIVGSTMAYFNEKLKNTKYKNYLRHIFYMLGFISPKKRLPPSYKRYFLA